MAPITGDAPIITPTMPEIGWQQASVALIALHARQSRHIPGCGYIQDDLRHITRVYWELGETLTVNPLLALAQMCHETAFVNSPWSQPPNHNPAGIGVTGEPGKGIVFPNWTASIRAHLGRLVAYALDNQAVTPLQAALVAEASAWRPFPSHFRGVAPTLRGLNGKWAVPGTDYCDRIARAANAIQDLVL